MKNNIYYIALVFVLMLIGVGAINIYAWKSPSAVPPSGGVQAPVTSLINEQLKMGSLGVSGVFAVFGNTVFNGNVKIADGTQKEFYALVSDSVGNASWQKLPARPVRTHTFKIDGCPEGSSPMNDRGIAYCGYWVNNGVVSMCKKGDTRIQAVDTGTSGHKGGNHGISIIEPNGCMGWEGEGNNGGAGCAVLCRAKTTYK